MLIVVHVVLIAGFAFFLAKHSRMLRGKLYWMSFGFHLMAGISVGLIYTYYYTANDTWFFFEDAKMLSQTAKTDLISYLTSLIDLNSNADLVAQDSRSIMFIKILSFFSIVTGDNYWLCAAYFSLLSFAASWFLYTRITVYFEQADVAAGLTFLFFPSVVFWSSGIEKETLTLAALYFLVGLFLQYTFAKKIRLVHWPVAMLAVYILWTLKYYWAGVFIVAVIASVATNYLTKQEAQRKYRILIYLACLTFTGIGVSLLHPNFYLYRFLEVVVANHDAFVLLSNDQNMIHFYHLSPTVSSMAINAPWALVSGIFRPFIGEGQGMLGLAASLENFLILILAGSFAWANRKRFRAPISPLFLAATSYCIVLCIFLALSTPNFGTLSRYRVGFLPFLIFIFAYRNPLVDFIAKKFSP